MPIYIFVQKVLPCNLGVGGGMIDYIPVAFFHGSFTDIKKLLRLSRRDIHLHVKRDIPSTLINIYNKILLGWNNGYK